MLYSSSSNGEFRFTHVPEEFASGDKQLSLNELKACYSPKQEDTGISPDDILAVHCVDGESSKTAKAFIKFFLQNVDDRSDEVIGSLVKTFVGAVTS